METGAKKPQYVFPRKSASEEKLHEEKLEKVCHLRGRGQVWCSLEQKVQKMSKVSLIQIVSDAIVVTWWYLSSVVLVNGLTPLQNIECVHMRETLFWHSH